MEVSQFHRIYWYVGHLVVPNRDFTAGLQETSTRLYCKCIRQWSSFRRGWSTRGYWMILKMANRQCCWRFLHCFFRSWNKCNLKLMLNVCLCSLLCTLDRTCWNDLCLEWRLGIFSFYQCNIEWWLCIPEGIPMASIKSVTCPSDLLYFCVDKLLYVSFWELPKITLLAIYLLYLANILWWFNTAIAISQQ